MKKMGLEPCPICKLVKMEEQESGSLFRIQCPGCKTVTRWFEEKRAAKTAWNLRETVSPRKPHLTEEEEEPPTI